MAQKPYKQTKIGSHMLAPETQMMRYGYDPMLSEGSLKTPLFQTSTFAFKSAEDGKAFFALSQGRRDPDEGEEAGLIYTRINNPNLEIVEDRLTLWDSAADAALVFASGMAAISTAILTYVRPGDVIVYCEPIYSGTEVFIHTVLKDMGIKAVPYLSGTGEDTLTPALARAADLGRVSVIYGETPANPSNQLLDLGLIARAAKAHGAETGHTPVTMVDNTFLGPLWQQPCAHGIDVALYSLTKYVGGHSDLVAGGAVGRADILAPIRQYRTKLGTQSDPHSCWLLMRSLETLKIRMDCAAANARVVADYLRGHPKIARVNYLGFLEDGTALKTIFDAQCQSAGSTFSFEVVGGEAEAFDLLNRLKVIKLAVSLGGTESLMEAPYSMSHSNIPDAVKGRLQITPATLRISVGIENAHDLIADLRQALSSGDG